MHVQYAIVHVILAVLSIACCVFAEFTRGVHPLLMRRQTRLTGGCRAPVLRLHSDKAKEFLATSVRKLLRAHGIRQTTNSGYDPAANGKS